MAKAVWTLAAIKRSVRAVVVDFVEGVLRREVEISAILRIRVWECLKSFWGEG